MIDGIFFGSKNVYNYKAPFKVFDQHVASNTHNNFQQMRLWLLDDPEAPSAMEIWGRRYKQAGDMGISNFTAWQDNLLAQVVATKEVKRSHKKKQKQKE